MAGACQSEAIVNPMAPHLVVFSKRISLDAEFENFQITLSLQSRNSDRVYVIEREKSRRDERDRGRQGR